MSSSEAYVASSPGRNSGILTPGHLWRTRSVSTTCCLALPLPSLVAGMYQGPFRKPLNCQSAQRELYLTPLPSCFIMVSIGNLDPPPFVNSEAPFECGHGRPLQGGREARDARFSRALTVVSTLLEDLQRLFRPPWPPSPPAPPVQPPRATRAPATDHMRSRTSSAPGGVPAPPAGGPT